MRTVTDDLATLATKALADDRVATKGPWEVIADDNAQQNIYADQGFDWIAMLPHQCVSSIEDMRKVDAEFIAAARTREPLLAAGVLDLTRQLAEARAEIERLCRYEQCIICHRDLVNDDCVEHGGAGVSARAQICALADSNERLRTRLIDWAVVADAQLATARAEADAMTAARDEACDFADVLSETFNQPLRHVDVKLIAELRAVGAKP